MALTYEQLVEELIRQRSLNAAHRRISQEAEAEVRELRWKAKSAARDLKEFHERLRKAYAGSPISGGIEHLWRQCSIILDRLENIESKRRPGEE